MTVCYPKNTSAVVCDKWTVTANIEAGILQPDFEGDFWADHDENCHGIIDSRELQEEYPEGYKYECCGQENKTPGCSTGRHIERKSRPTKRRRY